MSGHVSPKSLYFTIFGALMVFTGLTIGAAFVNLGSMNFPVAIAIAITKATLVILFFMHAKYSSRLTKLVIGSAFFFLGILLTLTLTDYLSRGWHTSARGTTTAGTFINDGSAGHPVPTTRLERPPARTEAQGSAEAGAEAPAR